MHCPACDYPVMCKNSTGWHHDCNPEKQGKMRGTQAARKRIHIAF